MLFDQYFFRQNPLRDWDNKRGLYAELEYIAIKFIGYPSTVLFSKKNIHFLSQSVAETFRNTILLEILSECIKIYLENYFL